VNVLWKILATFGLVGLNGFFVAAEFAAVSARRSRLEMQAETDFLARVSIRLKDHLDLYLSSCQLGITIASLGLGYVTEPAIVTLIDPAFRSLGIPSPNSHAIAVGIALTVSTSLHVVVGEVAPKNWAIYYPDRIIRLIVLPLMFFTFLCYPVIWILNSASNALLKVLGVKIDKGTHGSIPHTVEELRALLTESVAHSETPTVEEKLLTSAFDFGDLKARQIMTPRTLVDFLRVGQPIDEVLKTIQKTAYTRLPLCEGDIDHVIGFVHVKDLFNQLKLVPGRLRFGDARQDQPPIAIVDGAPGSAVHVIGSGDIDLVTIKREVLLVPDTIPVPKLLQQFQAKRLHMAIVADEYGATLGIVTLEDVIEEIVGEIDDEFDAVPASAQPAFVEDGDSFHIAGLFPLHHLRERLQLGDAELQGVNTLGGYITQQLGRWPRPGDRVKLGGYSVKVDEVLRRQVTKATLTPTAPNEGDKPTA